LQDGDKRVDICIVDLEKCRRSGEGLGWSLAKIQSSLHPMETSVYLAAEDEDFVVGTMMLQML
jgi:hypothetical protein